MYSTTTSWGNQRYFEINILIYFLWCFIFSLQKNWEGQQSRVHWSRCLPTPSKPQIFVRCFVLCKYRSNFDRCKCFLSILRWAFAVIRQDNVPSSPTSCTLSVHSFIPRTWSSEKLKIMFSMEKSHTQDPWAFLSNRLKPSDEKRCWAFSMSIQTGLGWNSFWELWNKTSLICLCYGSGSVILCTRGLKHSHSLFFSNGSAIAMVFINTWCEMAKTLEYKCIDVWHSFISLASFIKNVACTTVVITSAPVGLLSQFSDNWIHP